MAEQLCAYFPHSPRGLVLMTLSLGRRWFLSKESHFCWAGNEDDGEGQHLSLLLWELAIGQGQCVDVWVSRCVSKCGCARVHVFHVYVCVRVYVGVCVYVSVSVWICEWMSVWMHVYVCGYVSMWACVDVSMCVCFHVYVCGCICGWLCVCMKEPRRLFIPS